VSSTFIAKGLLIVALALDYVMENGKMSFVKCFKPPTFSVP